MSKIDELERIWLAHRLNNRNAWRYPSKWEVAGYLGIGPITIISFQPSGDVQFQSPQARRFYAHLKENGVTDSHIMDVLSSELGADPDEEEEYFQEQLRIVHPAALLVMGKERGSNWNRTQSKGRMAGPTFTQLTTLPSVVSRDRQARQTRA